MLFEKDRRKEEEAKEKHTKSLKQLEKDSYKFYLRNLKDQRSRMSKIGDSRNNSVKK
jgi:hypothetical protein